MKLARSASLFALALAGAIVTPATALADTGSTGDHESSVIGHVYQTDE